MLQVQTISRIYSTSNRVHEAAFENGSTSITGALFTVGNDVSPASLDIIGLNSIQFSNFFGNTVVVSRAASLGLFCNTNRDIENGNIRLLNQGTFIHRGELWLRTNWYANHYILNRGDYIFDGDSSTDISDGASSRHGLRPGGTCNGDSQ